MYVKYAALKDLKIPKINSQILLYLKITSYQHNKYNNFSIPI